MSRGEGGEGGQWSGMRGVGKNRVLPCQRVRVGVRVRYGQPPLSRLPVGSSRLHSESDTKDEGTKAGQGEQSGQLGVQYHLARL